MIVSLKINFSSVEILAEGMSRSEKQLPHPAKNRGDSG